MGTQTEMAFPEGWTGANLGPADRLAEWPEVYEGKFAFKLAGQPGVTKLLRQAILRKGRAGARFKLEVVTKAEGTSPVGGRYQVYARFIYTDGTVETVALNFFKGSHPWKGKAKRVSASKDFRRIDLALVYENQTGNVWFDALHLTPIRP